MANLDTASKRSSSVSVLASYVLTPVLPDGALSQGDGQQQAWTYAGILATVSGQIIPAILEDLTTLWCLNYEPTIHAAHAAGSGYDDATLIHADLGNALGFDHEDDLNTAYAKYIDTDF